MKLVLDKVTNVNLNHTVLNSVITFNHIKYHKQLSNEYL